MQLHITKLIECLKSVNTWQRSKENKVSSASLRMKMDF